ncbi:hypothetical protein ACTHPH_24095 [Paenibacillus pasadenensis]|uniref:hypothetical protein n=1 Tax=Paenibacillus pasadenensis TaxID=217090 RepID=UPI0012EBCA91|nr:hypothetical protein [Paenibacillus pasadenensis]
MKEVVYQVSYRGDQIRTIRASLEERRKPSALERFAPWLVVLGGALIAIGWWIAW